MTPNTIFAWRQKEGKNKVTRLLCAERPKNNVFSQPESGQTATITGISERATGLYYYGARYLDPRTSRWLSGDPALGEYIPGAPANDEVKKKNQELPGQGGIFNIVNMHVYHYAANNPINYTDPNGRIDWKQFGGGLAQATGGGITFIGGLGIATTTGVTGVGIVGGIALAGYGGGNFLDGLYKMGFAFKDIQYKGVAPMVAGEIARNNGADEATIAKMEAGTGLGLSLTELTMSAMKGNVPGIITSGISAGFYGWDLYDSYNSSNLGTPITTSSSGPSFSERFASYQQLSNSGNRFDRMAARQMKDEMTRELDKIIDSKAPATAKARAIENRRKLHADD